MNLSFWEHKTWFSNIDVAVIGSGIVGLSCALSIRKRFPDYKIVVFEKGMLPSGASTKNAGFACFGSVSEILDDLKTHSETELLQLVSDRVEGLRLLRKTFGDDTLGFQVHGGYEIFDKSDPELYTDCIENLATINKLLKNVFPDQNDVFYVKNDPFGFKNIQKKLIFNQFEGQLDTGLMMRALIRKASKKDIFILNKAEITSFSSKNDKICLELNHSEQIEVKQLCIATNGYARQFIEEDVLPARAQVLVTEPIPGLQLKGTFHLDRGYYYFRNIGDRILLGGGRNLDPKGETTTEAGVTRLIQERLEHLLTETILPGQTVKIERRWSGIMGVGSQKKPCVKQLQPGVYCGVRLGGMGVAIGSSIGQQLAALVTSR